MMGYVTAIGPTLGVLAIFWIAIRAMVQADRRERVAQARIELAEREREQERPVRPDDAAPPAEPR